MLAALLPLLAAAVLGPAAAGADGRTVLTISYREDGFEPETTIVWTLRCNPTGGTHPRRTAACAGLRRVGRDAFRPVPKDVACTEIYGGPQTAVVSGTIDGRRVWARLRRDNGCEIARWNRLSPWLLPPGGAT